MSIEDIIRFIQEREGISEDGKAGPETWGRIFKRYGGKVAAETKVDERSEKAIVTLHEKVRPYIRNLVLLAGTQGIKIIITSGTRTYAEQDALYAQGRSKPGPIVTSARGGQSAHNFGTAADFTIFNGATPVWESPNYRVVGSIAKSIGLSWGGAWSRPDEPHTYLQPDWCAGFTESQLIAGLRERKNAGRDVFA